MPDQPIALNLARIVHRLLTHPRGWQVEAMMEDLGIQPRTYRKYRKLLMESFPPFDPQLGGVGVEEVDDGEVKYLRIPLLRSSQVADEDFNGRIAALYMAQQMFGFLRNTDVGRALEGVLEEFEQRLHDRPFVRDNFLRNADRLFAFIPDAPKDYSEHQAEIASLVRALFHHRPVRVCYHSTNKGRDIEIVLHPYSLVSYRSALYLIALNPYFDNIRTYAVDRIRGVEILQDEERFAYPTSRSYDPNTFFEGSFGIYHSDDGSSHDVELIFADIPWLKLFLQERCWHPTQRFEELDDGRLRMTFRVGTMAQVWPWIRSFGTDIEVIRPEGGVPAGYSDARGKGS